MLLNRLPCAILLESDIAFAHDFPALLRSLPVQWNSFDVLKLERCNQPQRWLGSAHRKPSVNVSSGPGGWCAAAYIASYDGARRMRAAQTPLWTVADAPMKLWEQHPTWDERVPFHVLHTVPPLAWQNHSLVSELGRQRSWEFERTNSRDGVGTQA